MPKAKPCKGLRSRVRITKNGKVVSKSCGSSHRRAIKTPKRRRQLRRLRAMSPTAARHIKRLLGMM